MTQKPDRPTKIESLQDLDAFREGWEFEAKRAGGKDGKGELPKAFWESYSAMANTDGGLIALGVKERSDGSLEVSGIVDVAKVQKSLWDSLNDRGKVSANVLKRDDVTVVEIDGKNVLLIEVPRAERADLPVFLNGS